MSRQLFIRYLKSQSKTDPCRFYVYAYLRHKDSATGKAGTPYYIGKGQRDRAWKSHGITPVPKNHNFIIFLETNLSEIGAFALERRYIAWFGRKIDNTGILLNVSEGGEGTSGMVRVIDGNGNQSTITTDVFHAQKDDGKFTSIHKGNQYTLGTVPVYDRSTNQYSRIPTEEFNSMENTKLHSNVGKQYNKNTSVYRNIKTGMCERIDVNDKRILDGEFIGVTRGIVATHSVGYINTINPIDQSTTRMKTDDVLFTSGMVVANSKKHINTRNRITGEHKRMMTKEYIFNIDNFEYIPTPVH